ncbi:MAG: hypothetical protein AUJ28_01230 [Parcubacteria group bacterium CG1_02_37_51]|uniref:Phosphoribosyltransferase domain-containing protein n=2 Tax=Candidatus Komeiliibacteriota TaxID=1817908 RepID=A0A2M8DQX1_9BACT|nr:MAG: hypothetical protein AUJ28_01230 [Parcubacteria group bacterium CG1_02_37_51]PIY93905.1 MAG: hypothetical protein COY67_03450 [Candidatus Komeilibacteria bacterium CG_4_10_14_0_8_um_filter_37_78]PJC01709.1 MAG: hypothetical protein CO073_03050 [Candidatus Komeilibacteria bacterium CG_4_9_14_0_8_um_filter_36_9]
MNQDSTVTLTHGVYKKIIGQEEIASTVDKIADYIVNWYGNFKDTPVLLGVLNGVVYFLVDLHRALQKKGLTAHIDTTAASSYTKPGKQGEVKITKPPKLDLNNRTVIIVEDIVDSGNTARAIIDFILKEYKVKHLDVVALVLRDTDASALNQMRNSITLNYIGIQYADDDWLVGYGFDDDEDGRALPDIYKRVKIL